MLSYQELCYTEYSLSRKERYYPVYKSLCIFNNSKLQIKHQIRYFKNGQYINTISTDKAKLAIMPNNSSIYIYIYVVSGNMTNVQPRTKSPHNEIIIQCLYCFILMVMLRIS